MNNNMFTGEGNNSNKRAHAEAIFNRKLID